MFQDDLKAGERLERYILNKIQQGQSPLLGDAFPDAYKIEGYFKEYDIYIPSIGLGIEVKQDKKSQHTGNYLIEIEFDGKPSALSTTKANYWVFHDGECEIWTTPSRIKQAIKGLPIREFIGNGDTKYKKAYLCPKEKIKNTAEYILYEIYG